MLELKDIDVVVLCGGKGRRLRSILKGRPKPMAIIDGRPFLDILIAYLKSFGFRRLILCAGYKAGVIRRHYQDKESALKIAFSGEKRSLGTAGAIKNAQPLIHSSPFLVANGDSLCRIDLRKFMDFHLRKEALLCAALTYIKDARDYGKVSLGESARVIAFDEKPARARKGLINAGIYLFQKRVLSFIPKGKKFSLEKDFFPKMVSKKFYGYVTGEPLIDIGTPQRYKRAQKLLTPRG